MAAGPTWTSERVLALAPNPASAKAGQGLATSRKWSKLGQADDLIWGECQGSGSKPYQIKVIPAKSATSCSCPSRKFPCKHVLGLLLLWANSPAALAPADPPPWVVAWVETRAKKAEVKQHKAENADQTAEATPTDLAAKAKREAARLAKVVAGLEDLDLWLADLVRAGFATLGTRPKNLWDEQARRLVDAQCLGVARRLRQIDAMSLAGAGWQTALLDRLAQIHLLIEGFRHRDALPPAVLEDLRTAIGFPADLDAVRSGTSGIHVRDTWQVLGQAYTLEDRITVRRTWLRGRDTGRSALILDFSALGKPFEAIFEPGTRIDATLGFFPGAAPLRALVIERHAPAEPCGVLEGGTTIAAAQAAFGATLSCCPWVEVVPVILDDVILDHDQDGWSALDPLGVRVILSRAFQQGWRFEALTGGARLTLMGEFDGVVVNPVGVLIAGTFHRSNGEGRKLGDDPVAGSPGRWLTPDSALMIEATASAVVGVDRKAPPSPPHGHLVGPLAAAVDRPAAARLLALAAAGGLSARVGRKRQVPRVVPSVRLAPPEDRPECSAAAAARLRGLLADQYPAKFAVPSRIFEWFRCCRRAGERVPPDLLVNLLNFCDNHTSPLESVTSVLGHRGRWLAGRNPRWSVYAPEPPTEDVDRLWETGTKANRLLLLEQLRTTDPDRARRLVESSFATEPAVLRVEILMRFDTNLSMNDEPFLEAALDDRSGEVRTAAAERLRQLTGSRLADRMTARMRDLLRWSGGRLAVEPPATIDPALIRDGITKEPKADEVGMSKTKTKAVGERGWFLHEILARTPPAAIVAHLQCAPETFVTASRKSEWATVILSALESAAVYYRDASCCRAILVAQLVKNLNLIESPASKKMFAMLTPAERDAQIAARLGEASEPLRSSDSAVILLDKANQIVGIDLGRAIVRRLQVTLVDEERRATADIKSYHRKLDGNLRGFVQRLDHVLPFDLIGDVEALLAPETLARMASLTDDSLIASLRTTVDRWKFRRDMHQEFTPR